MEWLESLPTACHAVCDFARTGHGDCVLLEGAWIRAAAKRLYKNGYFIEDITCLDMAEGFVLLYHFDNFDDPGRLTIRVVLDRETPSLPSIADIFQGAEWHERECMDFFPVVFKGNPNPARLLLAADMQEKPLVKEEKDRAAMLEVFSFQNLVTCAADHPYAKALKDKLEADKAAAEAAAAAAAAEGAEGEAEEAEEAGE